MWEAAQPAARIRLAWCYDGIVESVSVQSISVVRVHLLVAVSLGGADAVVALPGGSGTLDELLEAISLKRLGSFLGPIVLVNTRGFFDPCIELLERCIEERFMDPRHGSMWQVVREPEEVLAAFEAAPGWSGDAIGFAAV